MALVLYVDRFWISPYAFSAFVALREKEVEFDVVELHLESREHKTPEFAALSLTERVPAIDHDGFGLAESQAIVEYVEEAFPLGPPVLPRHVRERARARQVMSWLRSDLMPLREARPTSSMFYEPMNTPLEGAALAAAHKLYHVAERLLPAGAHHLFSEWSVADADLAFALHRLVSSGDPVPTRLREFADRQWARPSVASFVHRARPPLAE